MQILARANVQSELIDDDFTIPNLIANRLYEVIGIEYEYYRLVDDYLDPILVHPIFCYVENYKYVKDWESDINEDKFCLMPAEFIKHTYFYENLHDGNLAYVDIYLRHLNRLYGENILIDKIISIYSDAIKPKNSRVSYWFKQWVKNLFGVDKAIELCQFNEDDLQQRLSKFLN